MIGVLDTVTLARTKLRSKRILLIITVLVSGLLFGIITGALLLATGASRSISEYFATIYNNHYFVSVSANVPYNLGNSSSLGFTSDIPEDLRAHLEELQTDYLNEQKSISKAHELPFDESTVVSIFRSNPLNYKDSKGNVRQMINWQSPIYAIYQKELYEDYIKTAHNTRTDLKKIASKYGATEYFSSSMGTGLIGAARYLPDGKEDLAKLDQQPDFGNSPMDGIANSVTTSSYAFAPKSFVGRFILPENAKRTENKTAIPVILATDALVKTFGKQLDIGTKPSDPHAQVAWMKQLQEKANGLTYTVCYRNQSDLAQLQKILQTNSEIADNKTSKDYTPPKLQYNLPTAPCGDMTVKSDTRTAQDKKLDDAKEAAQKEADTYVAPRHQLLTFQVVGVMSVTDPYTPPSGDIPSFLSLLLGSQSVTGTVIPDWLYTQLPAEAQHADIIRAPVTPLLQDGFDVTGFLEKADIGTTIVSFPSVDTARSFIKSQCSQQSPDCKKDFAAQAYGSNYLLTDTLSGTIIRIAKIALPIAVAVATIIIWITMARVIIDSRRETAVFRALGAKRRDIASIYLMYSLMVACLIVLFMLALGFGIALIINHLFSGLATDIAMIAYGSFSTLKPFDFVGINLPLLGALILCVFVISLIAAIPPLLRNVRRSPIRDMRDE